MLRPADLLPPNLRYSDNTVSTTPMESFQSASIPSVVNDHMPSIFANHLRASLLPSVSSRSELENNDYAKHEQEMISPNFPSCTLCGVLQCAYQICLAIVPQCVKDDS
ncbi:hypothetical protein FRC03_003283 [Tulasnella sp. 419]|nr:hypothetical protein FRC02_009123 [Tulasnella sp. 418]KAG8963189.1 hypothetical protein FRC03_003283 [Tulasnella sp. 419]